MPVGAIAFAVNNRQPKASGATMDEYETDGLDGGVLAGLRRDPGDSRDEVPGEEPSVPFYETAEPLDFQVDYEHSGDRRVDDALDRLAGLPGTPLPGHADVYDAVHTELRAILSEQPAGAQGPR